MRNKTKHPTIEERVTELEQKVLELNKRLKDLEPKPACVDDWFGAICEGCDG